MMDCGDKKLFTPGPLCVSPSVRKALDRDMGSRDGEFIEVIKLVQGKLLDIAGLAETHACVLIQGSGTFGVEATLQSTSTRKKKVLILSSGAYGMRMGEICERCLIPFQLVQFPEDEGVRVDRRVLDLLNSDAFESVAMVHCETTSGVMSPMESAATLIKTQYPSILFILDAMSSFGGVEANYSHVDYLITSPNKCLQGVPGFAIVLARTQHLLECKGRSLSLCLDLYDQWKGLEGNGQFRFTPPTHALLGLKQAIQELEQEEGVKGRAKRELLYKENNRIIKEGMTRLGFIRFVPPIWDGHIITSFKYPKHSKFQFKKFYDGLSQKGQLIYPGKVTREDCFRIGNIGHLFPEDMRGLLVSIEEILSEFYSP